MTERKGFLIGEMKERLLKKSDRCEACGRYVFRNGVPQLAHRIGQGFIKVYGSEIIHHEYNLALVCNDLSCNKKIDIGKKPGKIKPLVEKIRKAIEEERQTLV